MSKEFNEHDTKTYSDDELRRMKSSTNLEKLDAMSDHDIDYSDSPELTDHFWANAKVTSPGKKIPISMRVDPNMLEWYKSHSGRYQKLMHEVLQQYMRSHQ